MTRNRIILAVVGVAFIGFVGYSVAFPKAVPKQRISGAVYVLPKSFTLNMRDGRYATLTAALVLAPGQSDGSGSAEGASAPPEGFGTLPEEAAIRDIITNVVTGQSSKALISPSGRERTKRQILQAIRSNTDVKVEDVLFTDVAVQ